MDFSTFFSKQAKKPSGFFGRFVMSFIFDRGNAILNRFSHEMMAIQTDDRVLDIGCGTGKLIFDIASQIGDGYIEGVDYSSTMVSIARRKNKQHIKNGKVKISEGDFGKLPYMEDSFDKVCSVNTIYFWPDPEYAARKIACILKPGGIFVVAFEDIKQLEQRRLNKDIFHFYTTDDVRSLLTTAGFSAVDIESREKGKSIFHCLVARK